MVEGLDYSSRGSKLIILNDAHFLRDAGHDDRFELLLHQIGAVQLGITHTHRLSVPHLLVSFSDSWREREREGGREGGGERERERERGRAGGRERPCCNSISGIMHVICDHGLSICAKCPRLRAACCAVAPHTYCAGLAQRDGRGARGGDRRGGWRETRNVYT